MKRLSLRSIILLCATTLTAISAMIAVFAWFGIATIHSDLNYVTRNTVPSLDALGHMRATFLAADARVTKVILATTAASVERGAKVFQEEFDALSNAVDGYEALISDDEERALYTGLKTALDAWKPLADTVIAAALEGNDKKAKSLYWGTLIKSGDAVTAALDAETAFNATSSEKQSREAAERVGQLKIALGIVVAVAMAIAGGVALLLNGKVIRALRDLTASMSVLAKGDTSAEVPRTDQQDEVGDMARSLMVFRQNAIARVEAEAGAAREREQAEALRNRTMAEQQAVVSALGEALSGLAGGDLSVRITRAFPAETEQLRNDFNTAIETLQTNLAQAAEERERAEADRAEKAAALEVVVSSIAKGLRELSQGNLAQSLKQPFAPEYEQLRSDFNEAVSQLKETVTTIVGAAQGIRNGSHEISQAASDLSRRTETQAASLEETAAALDEITETVNRTAEGAAQAHNVVLAARSDAENSDRVVRETIAAMSEIEKSSAEISQILGVIDDISFQTNLLALNAGVEAARAGEAGKGFAVVASEVRSLAQRSSDAAKEIRQLIATSASHVQTGVRCVGEAGNALQVIIQKVGELSGVAAEIASSAKEQATSLGEVNGAIGQMDQVTQQNASMVEETTAASHTLTDQANELADLMKRFRTGDAASEAARPAAAAKPAARTASHAPAKLASVSVGRTDGNAALAQWEDF